MGSLEKQAQDRNSVHPWFQLQMPISFVMGSFVQQVQKAVLQWPYQLKFPFHGQILVILRAGSVGSSALSLHSVATAAEDPKDFNLIYVRKKGYARDDEEFI